MAAAARGWGGGGDGVVAGTDGSVRKGQWGKGAGGDGEVMRIKSNVR